MPWFRAWPRSKKSLPESRELVDYYAQVLLDEAQTPSNWAEWEASENEQCHNASCGDSLATRVSVVDGLVKGVKWHSAGCTLSRAAASVMSRAVTGMAVEDVLRLSLDDVKKEMSLQSISPGRIKCVLLLLSCIQRQLKTEQTTKETHE